MIKRKLTPSFAGNLPVTIDEAQAAVKVITDAVRAELSEDLRGLATAINELTTEVGSLTRVSDHLRRSTDSLEDKINEAYTSLEQNINEASGIWRPVLASTAPAEQ